MRTPHTLRRATLGRAALATAATLALAATGLPAAYATTSAPAAAPSALASSPATDGDDWLTTDGNKVVDADGKEVWMTGANWFGFNATERVFHGLWSGNIETITKEMAERGINLVRVPVSTELLVEWKNGETVVPNVNTASNPELVGMNNKEVFDYWLELCEKYGLKVLVDVHSAEADNSGHFAPMWYTDSVSTEDFYAGWEWLAQEYKDNDTIVAADLENEPHGTQKQDPRAKWDDSTDPDNWKHVAETAAEKILAINPNLLILVEGNEAYPRDGENWESQDEDDYYFNWWGGNLRGAADHPVEVAGDLNDQIMYSPHDYGPLVFEQEWFEGDDWDRDSLEADVWDPNWLYLHKENTSPLLIGEWGGFLDGDKNEKWMLALQETIVDYELHHTFWCINPNSGDTGGLLLNDWATWDEEKYAILEPTLWQEDGKFVSLDHQVPLGGVDSTTGISVSDVAGGSSGMPDTTAPTVPQDLAASDVTSTTAELTWSASTDDVRVTRYEVLDSAGTVVGTPSGTSFTVDGLTPETESSFSVRARDAAGNRSAPSDAVTVTTLAGPPEPEGGCTVEFDASNRWSSGYTADIQVQNDGDAAWSAWELEFEAPAGQSLANGWSATWTQTGSTLSATSMPWNGTVAAGGSVNLGVQINGGAGTPDAFTVNGEACSIG
ncbi:Aryl-phospho-beta-D-glucosidase BglC, GH1 family [Paraoerskovia marina]|uniref:cellulase n=1 Tax=Paraoerskovia marina TaxID=545619 RepID=A0A1H1LTM4_9CELL|nr:cellulase family glycosylhydrolase [Paraoerskovia marina]SDR77692.1 Aryl-phospho-beta-D-glucosidase BglC, GH1 family [Paraoerskovia marina]